MNLERSSHLVARLDWRPESGSTNAELVALATGADALAWPDLSVLATDNQTEGRGRLGRTWSAPAGGSLAVSILLRPAPFGHGPAGAPALPAEALGWLPLLAGAAMAEAVRHSVPTTGDAETVWVKWPNDVLVSGRKVSGILSQLLPNGGGVVVGAGVNLFLTADQLPVPTATSLQLEGATGLSVDGVLAAYLGAFTALYRAFEAAGGDARASGLAARVSQLCGTLGQSVRVELPGGDTVSGRAVALEDDGRLRLEVEPGGRVLQVAAGDVTHLRY
ncbi:biotin--[acetyl-CoA-carboxylase] ligase [Subtercola vilae]|uniref:biotin--[biotin carboxyl-carrier protein] ligase n=1 Tax=Subtercola vilae TaxID=2056433 RepID=A0A4T2C3S2_9MICO|nr:biotin--[acetyl-CoA-carboxylase] ligase [Subtercola vilae]TIH37791.1 biotin--[acetyl-CoA-carboxylase] ligase [Subtercola vilae]